MVGIHVLFARLPVYMRSKLVERRGLEPTDMASEAAARVAFLPDNCWRLGEASAFPTIGSCRCMFLDDMIVHRVFTNRPE